MSMNNDFTPAEGVTMENAIRYILAVEEAAMNEFNDLPPEDRRTILATLGVTMRLALNTIARLIELHDLIEEGIVVKSKDMN